MGGNLARGEKAAGRNAEVICRLAISDIQKEPVGDAAQAPRYRGVVNSQSRVKVQRIARNGRVSIRCGLPVMSGRPRF
jgi:hypothetical protein